MDWLAPIYLWSLTAIPVAVLLYLFAHLRRKAGIMRLGEEHLIARLSAAVSARTRTWKAVLTVVSLGLLGVSLAGPRFGTKLREVKREGIDLVIALDVSASMLAEDVAPNRLERSKNEIKKLLDLLKGDRVGLVLFSGDAFIQCPLTTDYGAVRLFLDVANPSLIPTPGTDFSVAARMALKAFETAALDGIEDRTRALLIVSDGENHVPDADAMIEEARGQGVVIYTAGVGETVRTPIPQDQYGRDKRYKTDRYGRVVMTRLEEAGLQSIAENGAYFRIAKTSTSLPKIILALERLEKTEFGKEEFEAYDEKYQWPLAIALLLLAASVVLTDRRRPSGA